jgi:conjugative transfer pilus assembly protein TraH
MPSIDAGCGGINVNFGGFGYISGDQIQKIIKNIGSSALSYGVMLTIKSISPQISDLLENLEAMARFMNSQNINSCQMGASIAAGLFPKNEQSHRLACQARKMGGGSGGVGDKLSSYFTAREDCNDGEKATATNNEDKDKDKPLLPAEYNLVWYALKKEGSNLSRGDREFLMSLSGTVIAEKGKGGNISYKHKSSLMKGSGMINAIVFGGDLQSFKVYACDKEEDCLHPREISHSWSNKDSMYAKVIEVMQSLEDKILKENEGDNQSLDAKEKDLLSRSSMPILNLISLNAGLKGHGVKDTISEYAEVVAFDYTIGYLDDLTDFVYKALSNLEHSQIEGDTIKDFKEEIRSIRKSLFYERSNAMARLHTITSVKEITRQKEQQVFAMFADYRIKNGEKE